MDYPRHPAKRSQITLILLGIITLPFVIGIIPLVLAVWRHYSHTYESDGEVVRHNFGIISRDLRSVRIKDLREIGLRQSIVGRILNYGTLTFDTAAGNDREVSWLGVRNPATLREHFESAMRSAT